MKGYQSDILNKLAQISRKHVIEMRLANMQINVKSQGLITI